MPSAQYPDADSSCAELGQAPQRPKNKTEEFIWLLRGGEAAGARALPGDYRSLGGEISPGGDTGDRNAAGDDPSASERAPTPEVAEVEAYLEMNGGDVAAAVADWIADTDWEDCNAPMAAPPIAPATKATHVQWSNPMHAPGMGEAAHGLGCTESGTLVVPADRVLRARSSQQKLERGEI